MRRNVVLLALVVVALPVLAALPPLSPERLREQAELIVVGEFVDYRSEEKARGKGVVDTVFAIRVKVRAVEKNSTQKALQSGSVLTVHGSNLARAPRGWAGPSGNHTVDYRQRLQTVLELTRTKQIEARFYLASRDGKQFLVTPNGLELTSVRDRK